MVKKIIYLAAVIIIVAVFYGLSKQVYQSLRSGSRLDEEIEELGKLQKKNSQLQKKLSQVDTIQFIEEEARNKLNLIRTGEAVVIIPDSEINKVLESWREKKVVEIPNWQAWLRLFFK